MNRGGRLVAALALTLALCAALASGCTTDGPVGAGPAGSGPAGPYVSGPAGSGLAGLAEPTATPTAPQAPVTPTAVASSPGRTPPDGPVRQPLPGAAPGPYQYVFPVGGKASYERTHHDYPASDIIAACGLPVRAVIDGRVLEVNRVDRWNPATNLGSQRGGLFVSILGDDGVRYYGSHLRSVTAGLGAGSRVRAGDEVGKVGNTGDAGACHLHFGISPLCEGTGDWATRRGAIWPWAYLDSWRAGGAKSPAAEIATWVSGHGCG